MKFRTDAVQKLSEMGNHAVVDGLLRYDDEHTGTWRWGEERRIVFGPNEEGAETFAYDYRLSSGDGDYTSWDDEDDVIEAYRVVRQTVVTTTWVRF
jgi:hypothetical protein